MKYSYSIFLVIILTSYLAHAKTDDLFCRVTGRVISKNGRVLGEEHNIYETTPTSIIIKNAGKKTGRFTVVLSIYGNDRVRTFKVNNERELLVKDSKMNLKLDNMSGESSWERYIDISDDLANLNFLMRWKMMEAQYEETGNASCFWYDYPITEDY